MRINYFSSGPREKALYALIKSAHEIEKVFVTEPNSWPKVIPTIELAKKYNIPVHIIDKSDLLDICEFISGENCLSVGFGYLFPDEFIAKMNLCINVHGTLLPKYAGARTLNWILENNEKESGITVHLIDAGVDTGPIIFQEKFSISKFDTVDSLYARVLSNEPNVILRALDKIDDDDYQLKNQCHNDVVSHKNRRPEHSEIDPEKSLIQLFDKIRACPPNRYPAYFFINGEKVCIKLWRPDKDNEESFSELMI